MTGEILTSGVIESFWVDRRYGFVVPLRGCFPQGKRSALAHIESACGIIEDPLAAPGVPKLVNAFKDERFSELRTKYPVKGTAIEFTWRVETKGIKAINWVFKKDYDDAMRIIRARRTPTGFAYRLRRSHEGRLQEAHWSGGTASDLALKISDSPLGERHHLWVERRLIHGWESLGTAAEWTLRGQAAE